MDCALSFAKPTANGFLPFAIPLSIQPKRAQDKKSENRLHFPLAFRAHVKHNTPVDKTPRGLKTQEGKASMEVLRFSTNVTEEVALKFDDGKAVEGRYGDQVLYTLTDGRLMYLPPIAAKRITDLRIAKGEAFQVCKKETTRGQKRSIEWEVKRVDPMPESPAPETAAAQTAAASNHQVQTPQPNGSTPKLAVINGNPQGQADEAALSLKMVAATQLTDALKTAVAAAAAAEEFGKAINYSVRFDGSHIYAMACTVLIGKQKELNGGYR